ncbi:MAG: hypothetical protein LBQ95_01195 [Lachnospiraceae bacterium]|jgi:predicted AAA+ superfamily ATPase|nr:hypothetical protein [Lachnospiraceae bacterium]
MEIIGRNKERSILKHCEESGKPEFVAVYGRRRVGKTYLIVEHFGNRFSFSVTGVADGNKKDQLREFHTALTRYYQGDFKELCEWHEAFYSSRNIVFSRRQIAEAYMIFGGIPFIHLLRIFLD